MIKRITVLITVVMRLAVITLIIGLLLNIFVFATSVVQGGSMNPILEEGNRVVFNKAAYVFDEPERGDIIIIQRPMKNYVKRIIGLPGETVEVKENNLFIDGKKHQQTFLPKKEVSRTSDFGPIVIPDNSYFVMGDNRIISKDSRNGLGFVSKQEIIGRSELVIYPFNEFSFTR